MNERTIRDTYRFLNHEKNGITELRVIGFNSDNTTKVGACNYVTTENEFVSFCRQNDGKGNVFTGINPISSTKLNGRYIPSRKEDVLFVQTIVIDIDPLRPKGMASTKEEMNIALKVGENIANDFEDDEFIRPIINMSGNGCQLWFAIPPIELSSNLRLTFEQQVKALENELLDRYDEDDIQIDSMASYNHLIKVIGTTSVKGENTKDRPHRISKTLSEFTRQEDPKLLEYILSKKVDAQDKVKLKVDTQKLESMTDMSQRLLILKAKSKMCDGIKRLWMEGFNEDRSVAIFNMVMILAHYRFTFEEIIMLATYFDTSTGMNKLKGRDSISYITQAYEKVMDESNGEPVPPHHWLQDKGFCTDAVPCHIQKILKLNTGVKEDDIKSLQITTESIEDAYQEIDPLIRYIATKPKSEHNQYISKLKEKYPKFNKNTLKGLLRSVLTEIKEKIKETSPRKVGRKSVLEVADKLKSDNDLKGAIVHVISHKSKEMSEDGKKLLISRNFILPDIEEKGKFYNVPQRGEYYWFKSDEKSLFYIPVKAKERAEFIHYLNEFYGLNPESYTNTLLKDMHSRSLYHGKVTKVHDLSFYDTKKHILYINRFDNQFYKINGKTITLEDNGTDGVLFVKKQNRPWEYKPSSGPWELDSNLIDDISFAWHGKLSPKDLKKLFRLVIYSYFFPQLLDTKPISLFYGQKGSGKSLALKRIHWLLKGQKFNLSNVPKNQRDFETQLTSNKFLFYDNVDEHQPMWFKDGLTSASTGMNVHISELYATNKQRIFLASPYLGICTRTANFTHGRDDLADRCLVFSVEPIKRRLDEGLLFKRIIENRNAIFSTILDESLQMVSDIRDNVGKEFHTKFRMADFTKFVHDSLPGEWSDNTHLFDKMLTTQSDLASEGSKLYDVISGYLGIKSELSGYIADIYESLRLYSQALNISFYQIRNFRIRLKSEEENLRNWFDFYVTDTNEGGGHAKLYYKIKKK